MNIKFKPMTALLLAIAMSNAYADKTNDDIDVLQTVTVTTTLQDVITAPASTTVLTESDFKGKNITKISDLINNVVGVSTGSNTGRKEYQIRGMEGKYTLILVDGKRVSSKNALWRGSNFDNMPISIGKIARVEIIRGPMSALYGSDALGGVINIITKVPGDELSGHISLGGTKATDLDGGDSQHVSAYLEAPLTNDISASISLAGENLSEWNRETPNTVHLLEGTNTQDLGFSLNWDISDNQSLELTFDHSTDHRENGIYRLLPITKGPAKGKIIPLHREQEIKRNRYSINHTIDWDWGNTNSFISFEKSNIDDFNTAYATSSQKIQAIQGILTQQRNPGDFYNFNKHYLTEKNINAKTYTNIDNLSNQVLTIGGEISKTTVKDPYSYTKTKEGKTHTLGLFIQDEISVGEKTNITLGGRYDKHNIFGGHFSPKAYISHQPTDHLTIKGGFSQAFKAPSMYQLNPGYTIISCGGRCNLSGNENLKPETSNSFELSSIYSDEQFSLGATGFYSKAKNFINAPLVKTDKGLQRQWKNVNKVDIYGLELEGGLQITDDVSAKLNYTYLNPKDSDNILGDDKTLPNRSKHQSFAQIDWQINDYFTPFVAVHYESKKKITVHKGPTSDYTYLKDIFTWDIGTNFKYNNFSIDAGINNVSNVKLHEKEPYLRTAPGRVYYANVRYDF